MPRRPAGPFTLLVALLAPWGVPALAGEPPSKPFPRFEAGQHTARIWRIGVDAKGRWLVTASDDKTARVWDLKTGDLARVLRPPIGEGNEGKLYAAALTPDGVTVAVGGSTGYAWDGEHSIYLFDRQTGELRRRIGGLPDVISHLAFSPDGKRLAAALSGGAGIRVFATDTWAEVGRDTDYGSGSYWVAFDGQGRLASTCEDGLVRLYDRDLKPIAKGQAPGGQRPFGIAFSPDGTRIAVGSHDATGVNVLSGKDLSLVHAPETSALSTVAWAMDGRTLFAGGRHVGSGDDTLLVSWSHAGRGPPVERPIAKNTIMGLIPLGDGRLVFGSGDPAWGLLDADGRRILGRGPAIADFRRQHHELRLSEDGWVAEVDLKVLGAEGRWREHILRLDLRDRRPVMDPGSDGEQVQRRLRDLGQRPGAIDGVLGPSTREALRGLQRGRGLPVTGEPDAATRTALGLPRLAGPHTEAPGLQITDWHEAYEPKRNGKSLDLDQGEYSWRLDIGADGSRFLLGTSWFLRLYDRDGGLVWKTPVPSTAVMVKLSGDGRWVVAAFGDGSIRWLDAARGKERLAFFVDGAAIAAGRRGEGAGPTGTAAPTGAEGTAAFPWVLWTPEGFFDSAGGGGRLMGWHLNRGADQAGELIDAGQIGEVFRRPDLIAKALSPEYAGLARAALAEIGDLDTLLAQGSPPALEPLGPRELRQPGRGFEARFRVEDRGGGVGRIEYRVNGALVGQGDLRGRFGLGLPNRREETRPFTLDPGRNRVEARGFDAKGRIASPWAVWEVEVTGKARKQPALYGLAVGIGPYKDKTLSLEYGDDDAAAFAAALNGAGQGLFREAKVKALVNEQATLAGITVAFEAEAAKAGPEDVFVLFLAGHGLSMDGRYHFIPWELKYTSRKALEEGSLHEDRLRDLLARVQAQKSLVVLDSCYAGAALGGQIRLAGLRGGEALETRAAIDRLTAKTGRAILASTTDRTYALEGLEGHGVFTHVLLEGLKGRADLLGDQDGTIETDELANYLADEVPRLSLQVWKYAQEPWNDLQGQSFSIGLRRAAP